MQAEVANVACGVANAVSAICAGRLQKPDAELDTPRMK
ncbi:protein of unknown function (plasmid) [Pararobbsia alpina]